METVFWAVVVRASLITVLAGFFLSACATDKRGPYSQQQAQSAAVDGFHNIRMWADTPSDDFVKSTLRAGPQPRKPFTYLALSGGGGEGAYGAGVIAGWTKSGNRPEFTIVSGVSTGALIAPFAFLGSGYDGTLKEIYTSGIASTFVATPNPLRAVFGSSLFSREPLREAVIRFMTPEVLSAIAAEHAKGRRLLVVTTNLDSDRPVVWDMGAIAATPNSRALDLFQNILVASTSVPVVFPPVLIDANADGHPFKEMHVDGTVTTPVFTFPDNFLLQPNVRSLIFGPKPTLFILMNHRIEPTFHVIENTTAHVANRSFSTKNKRDARGILSATYEIARRNGFAFNLTYIDKSVVETDSMGFETNYMRSLYDDGFKKAAAGRLWFHQPPTSDSSFVASR